MHTVTKILKEIPENIGDHGYIEPGFVIDDTTYRITSEIAKKKTDLAELINKWVVQLALRGEVRYTLRVILDEPLPPHTKIKLVFKLDEIPGWGECLGLFVIPPPTEFPCPRCEGHAPKCHVCHGTGNITPAEAINYLNEPPHRA